MAWQDGARLLLSLVGGEGTSATFVDWEAVDGIGSNLGVVVTVTSRPSGPFFFTVERTGINLPLCTRNSPNGAILPETLSSFSSLLGGDGESHSGSEDLVGTVASLASSILANTVSVNTLGTVDGLGKLSGTGRSSAGWWAADGTVTGSGSNVTSCADGPRLPAGEGASDRTAFRDITSSGFGRGTSASRSTIGS